MGFKSTVRTKTKRVKVDADVLENTDLPFVKTYTLVEKLKKLCSTYLIGVRREVVDGFLHPNFPLNFVSSFRGSSQAPNFQNFPARDEEIGKIIRSCFVPRPGHVLVETDHSGHEFRIASSVWSDSAMVKYASDPELDIHRDMAKKCFKLSTDEVTKKLRYFAKNQCVFPLLYGSYYISCAKGLWENCKEQKTADGVTIIDHLWGKRIKELGRCDPHLRPASGSFEKHIKSVEDEFNAMFPTWSQGKEDWVREYERRGWFDLVTGFRCHGVYSRNQLFNIPVQGPAFHCLLWDLIQLIPEMRRRKMESVVVGEIHDSILSDVLEDELDDYLALVERIMTEDIRREWSWILTPLGIESTVSADNWYEKKRAG
jgi:DNA polymerase I-like protein with 3'-5' exonuclease and polymerase domains